MKIIDQGGIVDIGMIDSKAHAYINSIVAVTLTLPMLLIACGGGAKPADTPASILNAISIPDIKKTSEVQTFVGQNLYEYIDGGAEVYHQYGFIEVSTADFKAGEIEITADIYRFATPDGAFGMYSTLRPQQADFQNVGVQGFASESNFDFVKGPYLVRLICFEPKPDARASLAALALALAQAMPGTTAMPEMFKSLPAENKVDNSEMMVAQSYLGQAGFDKVYTIDYKIDDTQCQLFISTDNADGIFTKLTAEKEIDPDAMKALKDLPFDSGKVLLFDDPYYGKILVGVKNSKLLGCVGYSENLKTFVNDWLNNIG
jgi:hypothetical protein